MFSTFRRPAQALPWIGVVERPNATEREVKLQLFGFPQGSRAYEAIERSDDKHKVDIHAESIESSTSTTLNPINPKPQVHR